MSEPPASAGGKGDTARARRGDAEIGIPASPRLRVSPSTLSPGTRPGSELFPVGPGTRLAVILWDALSSLSVFFATRRLCGRKAK